MQPTSQYSSGPGYGTQYYGGPVSSPHAPTGPQMQSNLPLPAMMSNPAQHGYGPPAGAPNHSYPTHQPFDTTGQIAPPGMKPRVTATLWEDEGSLCFQVEAKGVCVARREDNHFINGTKLLNVAGMTRGRRDGILKSEKIRHVVKIGPMHLKGVWIPFDRALEFANKEKITDILYPLFVHNIGGLLYNPENSSRTNAVVSATEQRRRMDSTDSGRGPQAGQAPALHHHHSMQGSVGGQVPSTPHSMTNPSAGPRPGIDRAHTFPTPPTSASSVMGMGASNGSYEWNQPGMANGVNPTQPLSIDTAGGMNNARSMPTTPATTPPGQSVPQMQPYSGHQSYDGKQHYYATTPSSQTGYAQQNGNRYDNYKSDMGPPTAPNTGTTDGSQGDHKQDFHASHPGSDSADHHENGYMNSNGTYGSTRPEYAYNAGQGHPQLSPEMTSSPHQAGSGRGTPRTIPGGQPQWGGEYRTPPQSNPGSMYSAAGDSRSSNAPGSVNGYPTTGYNPNQSLKRRRDDDEQDGRPSSRDTYQTGYDTKRQKVNESFGMPLHAPMQAIKTGPMSGR